MERTSEALVQAFRKFVPVAADALNRIIHHPDLLEGNAVWRRRVLVLKTAIRQRQTDRQLQTGASGILPANVHSVWLQISLLTLLPANVQVVRALIRYKRLFPGIYLHFCRRIAG
jgi:hypothetical protein